MLKFYLLVAFIVFLVFVVKYVYDKFYVGGEVAVSFDEKLIVVGDLLKRLGSALAWFPIAIYYLVAYRKNIVNQYKTLFGKKED